MGNPIDRATDHASNIRKPTVCRGVWGPSSNLGPSTNPGLHGSPFQPLNITYDPLK